MSTDAHTDEGAAASATPAAAPPMTAEEALVQMLRNDSDDDDETRRRVPLLQLQRACMKVPHLSSVLDGTLRYRLYMRMLFDDDDSNDDDESRKPAGGDAPPPSWWRARAARLSRLPHAFADYADKATDAHTSLAAQLARVLHGDDAVATAAPSLRELCGFVYYLASQTAAYVNDEFVAIVLTMATLVRDAQLDSTTTTTDTTMTAMTSQAQRPSPPLLLPCLYDVLVRVLSDYGASNTSRLYETTAQRLLCLLLQYHDPALSVHLEQHKVDAGAPLLRWTRSLFAVNGGCDAALALLDWVFVLGDAVMLPYVALSYLVTHRGRLLAHDSAAALTTALQDAVLSLPHDKAVAVDPHLADGRPVALVPVWSGKSLLQNAELLYRNTPVSTRRVLDFCLHPDGGSVNHTPHTLERYYAAAPCIPLERADLLDSFAPTPTPTQPHSSSSSSSPPPPAAAASKAAVEYIVIDCRSRDSYEYARLPTAVFVGDVVGYDAQTMDAVVARVASVRGAHLTIFGTGRPIVEEQNLLKMVVFHFVTRRYPYISITLGGFHAALPLLRAQRIRMLLSNAASHELQQQQPPSSQPSRPHANGDDGSDATSTRQVLASALSTLSDYVAHVPVAANADVVRQHAEELRSKAKEGVAAAGQWGKGLLQRAQERLAEVRAAHEAAAAAASAAHATTSTHTATATTTTTTTTAAPASVVRSPVRGPVLQGRVATASTQRGDGARQPTPAAAQPQPPPPTTTATSTTTSSSTRPLFSLGDDDEDDDLGLITSVPVGRPLKGVLGVDATVAPPTMTTTATTQPPAPAAHASDKAAAAATTTTTATTTTAVAAAPSLSATGGSLAADIDAEFEELFGNDAAPSAPRS